MLHKEREGGGSPFTPKFAANFDDTLSSFRFERIELPTDWRRAEEGVWSLGMSTDGGDGGAGSATGVNLKCILGIRSVRGDLMGSESDVLRLLLPEEEEEEPEGGGVGRCSTPNPCSRSI